MILKCTPCNYSANNQRSYNKHCKTKKHMEKNKEVCIVPESVQSSTELEIQTECLENENNKIKNNKVNNLCKYCGTKYVQKSSLTRHLLRCKIREQTDTIEKIKLQYELEKKDYEIKMRDLEIKLIKQVNEKHEEHNMFQKKVIASNSINLNGALKVSMNAMTFLNKYYNDTPPLKTFEEEFANPYQVYEEDGVVTYENDMYIIDGVSIEKDKYIVDKIMLLEINNDGVKFFAGLIESIYKNNKYPHLQAYWSKDTSRNNFTYREKITDGIVRWSPDQDGRIITSKVITPLLRFTVDVVRKELQRLALEVEQKRKDNDLETLVYIVKKQELIAGFINKVKKNELQEEIIKKVAPSFYLDVTKHLANIKKDEIF